MQHSQDHKSHFRSKIRHIFERLIRKFSYEDVDKYFPESDKKLIANIRKRKESLKRRKAELRSSEKEQKNSDNTHKTSNSKFQEAFLDSDSELDSDDEPNDENYIPDDLKEEKYISKVLCN